ncbi:MAG: hypothetical protein COW03_06005 [Cytophagales bacterium CG12_big_fil_rev_8_21_14_0_65_40_12]|nr:MAG: hypothetical protein COW03_06005 [Cytophagales bacterium CG12_big_fil_rev_8_21_14_0_65_40_12]
MRTLLEKEGIKMRKITQLIILVFGIAYSFAGHAQGSQLEEAEIVIRKDRKITLPPANRNFEKIPQLPVQSAKSKQTYSFNEYPLNLTPIQPNFRAVNLVVSEKQKEITGNYFKLGYGNFGTLMGEAYLGSVRNPTYLYNLYVRHRSSSRGPVFDKNSADGKTDVVLGGKFFNGTNTISGDIQYGSRRVHFYGYNPALDLTPDLIERKFTSFTARAAVEKTALDEVVSYHFRTNWDFFRDNFEARENRFNFDAGYGYNFSEQLHFDLQAIATFANREDTDNISRNYYNFRPRLAYFGKKFTIKAGANLAGDDDDLTQITTTAKDGFKVYPSFRLDVNPTSSINLYAGYEGDLEYNTFQGFSSENAFLQSDFILLNTDKQSDIFGGVNIDLTNGFRVNAGLSMATLQRLPFFTNSITDSTRFEVLYDGDAVNRSNVYGELVYENTGALRSALRFDYFNYELNTLADPYHKPQYQAVLNNAFFPIENLKVSADLYYLGGLVGLNRESNTRVELDDIIDLNLGGDYNLNERISVFLQFKNILGKEYERYLNYKARGIQFLGGITVSF